MVFGAYTTVRRMCAIEEGEVEQSCAFHSTGGYDRNGFVSLIPADAHGLRIKGRSSVNQKSILMMSVCQLHLETPPTVGTWPHLNRFTLVKIPRQLH